MSEADNVYLDFNDGLGLGGVRGVRDGANEGNAYFDGITLQRMD